MDNDVVDIFELNNEELIELYDEIIKHIEYLNSSLIEESAGITNE